MRTAGALGHQPRKTLVVRKYLWMGFEQAKAIPDPESVETQNLMGGVRTWKSGDSETNILNDTVSLTITVADVEVQ